MSENNNFSHNLTNKEKKEIKNEYKESIEKKDWNLKTEEITKEEKINNFFTHIEFLELDSEKKEEIAKNFNEYSKWDQLYWWEIVISSVIATLWLLHNSVAVVIWAMLVAPLIRPINALGYSIARGWWKIFSHSFKVLSVSCILAVSVSLVVTKVLWLNVETQEILIRTNPNIIDFLIAIFSAVIAVLWMRFTRLWQSSIVWVALAVSLLPPLSIVWIELAFGNLSNSFWAFMLFSANLIWILLVVTIFFWLYWFVPHELKMQTKVFKRVAIVTFLVILISIPLLLSFNDTKTSLQISNQTKTYLENLVWDSSIFCEISDIQVLKNTKENVYIRAVVKIPEWVDIEPFYKDIETTLSEEFDKNVVLELEIIRTISIGSFE